MTRVLFVCRENAGRSQVAQALYARRGGEARSAGTEPAAELHEAVVEALEELGIDVWNLPDPIGLCLEEVRELRATIEDRVAALPV
jgi:arsenate reductase